MTPDQEHEVLRLILKHGLYSLIVPDSSNCRNGFDRIAALIDEAKAIGYTDGYRDRQSENSA